MTSGYDAAVVAGHGDIDHDVQAASAADTVGCAAGVGHDVRVWSDGPGGRYFDLASLTKPLFTVPATLSLLSARGAMDEPVGTFLSWLPQQSATPTARQLLTHASGLPAELPAAGGVSKVRVWAADAVREAGRDFVTYSDVNHWLRGEIISASTRATLPALFARVPTTAKGAFAFGRAPVERAVPAGPAAEGSRLVHDGAARRLDTSGHAVAFGTLASVVHAVLAWLNRAWLTEPLRGENATCQTHAIPGGDRSLAWTLAGDPFYAVAHDWPPTTLCHTGFTGVSVALDPISRWWAVHLSNAVPIARDAEPILKGRRPCHAAAAAHLRATTDGLFPTIS